MVAWTLLEPVAAADGPVDDRPELRGHRHQARQRADRRRWCSCSASSPGWRRTRRCRTTTASQQGLPPLEKLDDEKVLVWPDLVYTELICMVALTAFLLVVGASPCRRRWKSRPARVKTPNPSKAPWYFLGLQEMLVYYDPWMAGVVLPSLIIVGLMAIPYHRLQQEGQRLLHDRRSGSSLPHLPVRLPGAVGDADHAGHVPARAELELLRAVSSIGTRTRWWRSTTSTCRSTSGSTGWSSALPKAPTGSGAADADSATSC